MKLFGSNKTHKHIQENMTGQSRQPKHKKEDTQELGEAYAEAERMQQNQSDEKEQTGGKKRRGWLIALLIIVAVVGILFLSYKLWRKPPEIHQGGIHTPTVDVVPTDSNMAIDDENDQTDVPDPDNENVLIEPEYDENGRKKGTYTFLLIGSDNGFGNTDTIIYGVFDTVDHTLNVVNIPRDTQVNVPWSIKRINAVYANSGNDMDRLRQEIGHLVGYEIDESYAVIDLEAFVKIVDCVGGVDYDVPVDMYDYIPDQNFNIAVPKGYQHLDGEKALQVVRFRSGYANADLGRINTQQDFLMSVAKQMLTLKNIPNLPQLLNIISTYVDTNLEAANIAFFIEEFLKLDSEDIHFYSVPGEGHSVKGGAYYFINSSEWVDIVNAGLNPFNVELTAANMNYLVYQSGDVYTSRGEYYGTSSFLDYNAYIQSLQN